MGRVVRPTPTPLSSRPVVPALVASYDMHGRAVGLLYTQPTGQWVYCIPNPQGSGSIVYPTHRAVGLLYTQPTGQWVYCIPNPQGSGSIVYPTHRAVGLFYTQPTGQYSSLTRPTLHASFPVSFFFSVFNTNKSDGLSHPYSPN